MQWLPDTGILTSAIVALLVVWLSSFFTYKNSLKNRVWERKAEAYSSIFEALYEMEFWFSTNLRNDMLRIDVTDEVREKRNEDYRNAAKQLRSGISREVWLLNEKVKKRTDQLDEALNVHHDTWSEHLDVGSYEISKTIEDLTKLAAEDMKSGRIH